VTDETTAPKQGADLGAGAEVAELAMKVESHKPAKVGDKEWRRHRLAAGHMVIIRSHFKSVYLVPMAIISFVLGVFSAVSGDPGAQSTYGLIWVASFCLYMNVFIFEWTRPWTFALVLGVVACGLLGMVLDPHIGVWSGFKNFFGALDLTFSTPTYWFFGTFFGLCSMVSFLKTRLNYVVVESNEVQIYRNALFGDRERISMLNPRVEVRVPDMLEYFHPFYAAGQIVIHAPDRTIVLNNVLHIRRIERATDRLGSALAVRVSA